MAQRERIRNECIDCNICVDYCTLFASHETNPLRVELESADPAGLAFSCFQCGLCNEVCPVGLRPSEMFKEIRREAILNGTAPVRTCRPWFADRENSLFSLYRSTYGIDYSALQKPKARSVLFPGCSLGTLHPALTGSLHSALLSGDSDLGMVIDCCYKPLYDLGLQERGEKATAKLRASLDDMGVEEIITACPSCQQTLSRDFNDRKVISCFSLLESTTQEQGARLTIHDSCSDREVGAIGDQARHLLSGKNSIVEMKHNRSNTICCGSGGMAFANNPVRAQAASSSRIKEAEESGAQIMVTYCANCANALYSSGSPVEVRHVLELLLNVREDYQQIRTNLQELQTGDSRKTFLKLFEDPS